MGQRRLFQRGEFALDPVEPGGIGGRELKAHVVGLRPFHDLLGAMSRQVVEDDPDHAGVPPSDRLEKGEKIARAFARLEVAVQFVLADVVIRQEMTDAVGTGVGGAKPGGLFLSLPEPPRVRP